MFLRTREGHFDLINAAQWLIAGASLLLLLAIIQRDQQRDEVQLAVRARQNMELQLLRDREQHREQTDALLDEINRLKGTNGPAAPAGPGRRDDEPAGE